MSNYLNDNHDLLFYLDAAGAPYHPHAKQGEGKKREGQAEGDAAEGISTEIPPAEAAYIKYLEAIGELAAVKIASRSQGIDRESFRIKHDALFLGEDLLRTIEELKILGAPHLPLRDDGRGARTSLSVQLVETELLARAELSVAILNNLSGGFALALSIGAAEAEKAGYEASALELRALAERAAKREIYGSIALHDPCDARGEPYTSCLAEAGQDGAILLNGEKIFVIGAGAPYLLVLARDDAAEPLEKGVRLSFFLVDAEKERGAGRLEIVETSRRQGHRGIPSSTLRFSGASAKRIGDERSGRRLLSIYQAGIRLLHAYQSIGLAEAAFRNAIKFAWETPFRGKQLIRHEIVASVLDEMELDLRSMRALASATAWHQGIAMEAFLGGAKEFDEEALRHHRERGRRFTSYLKYYVDTKTFEIVHRAAELRGAEGFYEGALEEKMLRDAAALPFDDGMSRMESLLDVVKDTIGALLKNPQEHVRQGARARWRTVSPSDPLEKRVARLGLLGQNAQQHLLLQTAGEKMKGLRDRPISEWTAELTRSWDPERDFAFATIHAERLTLLLAEIGLSEVFLAQSLRDSSRRELLERHLERAEPTARMLYEELTVRGRRIFEDPDSL